MPPHEMGAGMSPQLKLPHTLSLSEARYEANEFSVRSTCSSGGPSRVTLGVS